MELTLFDHFLEPVFYLEAGKICYSNQAAQDLEPQWTAGAEIPAALNLELDDKSVFFCTLGGQDFQVSVTRAGEGLLLFLRRLVQAEAALNAMLAALSIQLREQIHSLQNAFQTLPALVQEGKAERIQARMAVLNQSFYRLLRLTCHLDLAERAGRKEAPVLAKQLVDLVQLCQETAHGASCLAEYANVSFQYDVPEKTAFTMGDKELLEIMLLELISNAIKAAGKNGTAGLKFLLLSERVQITVWDSGPGMNQSDLTAMMDGVLLESRMKLGTGLRLGLTIARNIAHSHGGTILLESREGQGLRATISLPLKKPDKRNLRTPRQPLEENGGFSPLLTFLSDALPYTAFSEDK